MEKHAVVFNACYGGFSLSRAAVLRARELSGNSNWGGPNIKGDKYENGDEVSEDYGQVGDSIPRHDPILVAVVRELGDAADGLCAELQIENIRGRQYRITEYDGMENVETPDDVDWVVIDPAGRD